MTVTDVLALLAALLAGATGGWLMAVNSRNKAAERQRSDELEMADMEELYAAWANLRRIQPSESHHSCRPD